MSKIQEETTKEVQDQKQLTKGEAACIYRHLKVFVEKEWDKKEDVPDACTGCNQHYCSDDKHVLNPWSAFYKLAQFASEPYLGREGAEI